MSFNSVLNVKALIGAFNQEKALVGSFSVTNLRMDLFMLYLIAGQRRAAAATNVGPHTQLLVWQEGVEQEEPGADM